MQVVLHGELGEELPEVVSLALLRDPGLLEPELGHAAHRVRELELGDQVVLGRAVQRGLVAR